MTTGIGPYVVPPVVNTSLVAGVVETTITVDIANFNIGGSHDDGPHVRDHPSEVHPFALDMANETVMGDYYDSDETTDD